MRPLWCSLITVATILLLTGCPSRPSAQQRLTEQLAELTGDAADLLATVQDEASAAAAAPKLRDLLTRMNRLGEDAEAMEDEPSFSADNEEELAALGSYIAAQTRFMQEQQRISANQNLREGLGAAWHEMTGGLYDTGGVMVTDGKPSAAPAQITPAK